jgi:[acyl-carrier-protein] S-malonyltransferase
MEPAVPGLQAALGAARFGDPRFPIVANATAEPVRTKADAVRLLAAQLTAPVRWVACIQAAAAMCPGARFVEMGPGTVLCGLLKRILPGTESVGLATADDVEKFLNS